MQEYLYHEAVGLVSRGSQFSGKSFFRLIERFVTDTSGNENHEVPSYQGTRRTEDFLRDFSGSVPVPDEDRDYRLFQSVMDRYGVQHAVLQPEDGESFALVLKGYDWNTIQNACRDYVRTVERVHALEKEKSRGSRSVAEMLKERIKRKDAMNLSGHSKEEPSR